jgi:hypothetical protein
MDLNKIIKNNSMLFSCFGKKSLTKIGLVLAIASFLLGIIWMANESISNPGNSDPTVQYNQSSFPLIVNGTLVAGTANNLNILGEGQTYDVEEVIVQTDQTSGRGWAVYTNTTAANVGRAIVRNWTGSAIQAGVVMGTDSGGARSWTKLRCLEKRQECLLLWNDVDNDINFEVYHTDTNTWSNYVEIEGAANNDDTQNFDVECEDLSGECLIVYDDDGVDNQQIAYRVYNNGGLNAEELLTIGPFAGLADWIRLYPKNNSDEIMLVMADDNLDISAILWNGTSNSFKTSAQVITQDAPLLNRKSFDFAWEGSSGEGLLTYGTTTDGVFGFTYINYAWIDIGLLYNNGAQAYTIHMCGSNPLMSGIDHDYIGIMVNDQDSDLTGRVWDGTAIETSPTPPTEDSSTEGAIPTENIQCMWETTSKNQAVFIWVDNTALTPEGGTYTIGSGWSFAGWASGDSTGMTTWQNDVEDLQLVPDPKSDVMFVIGQDLDEDIECMRWTGSVWDAINCGLLESNAPSSLFESDTFDWDRYVPVYYKVEVWHNSSQISSGTLTFINATINFTSTVAATYSLQIYNWVVDQWNQTDCQTVNLGANEVAMLWCNKTESLTSYVFSDNVIRIRVNNTNHTTQGALKEDYVQYYIGYLPGYLEVQLIEPDPTKSTSVTQNNTFIINATVVCKDGPCGNVYGTARYNLTSLNPDTEMNTTEGEKPFFVNESPTLAMKPCPTNPLYANDFCNITWTINATGDIDTNWKIGVLFNSSYPEVQQNHTENATVYITSCTEEISLSWTSIDFGTFNPSTNYNNATYNDQNFYNITNKGACALNLWIRGTDLQNSTYGSTIAVGNLSWSNTTNNYKVFHSNMTHDYVLLNSSFSPNKNLTTYYWLSVPPVYAGDYIGSVFICGNYTSTC